MEIFWRFQKIQSNMPHINLSGRAVMQGDVDSVISTSTIP